MNSNIGANGDGETKWLVDSMQADITVINPSDRKVKRPWLLAVVDEQTSVLHHEVLLQKPTADDAARAIGEASREDKKRRREN